MEKIVEQGILYDFYGSLLTKHQQEIYEEAVYQDMSLTEIAQTEGISRQAVSDLIRRTTAQMQDYESRLGLIDRFRKIRACCERLEKAAEEGTADEKTVTGITGEIRALL